MVLKVQITRGGNGNLWVADSWGNVLFEFDYRGVWHFWLFGDRPTRTFEDFPMQYFLDACKVAYFLRVGTLPADVEITEGRELLTD